MNVNVIPVMEDSVLFEILIIFNFRPYNFFDLSLYKVMYLFPANY